MSILRSTQFTRIQFGGVEQGRKFSGEKVTVTQSQKLFRSKQEHVAEQPGFFRIGPVNLAERRGNIPRPSDGIDLWAQLIFSASGEAAQSIKIDCALLGDAVHNARIFCASMGDAAPLPRIFPAW